MNKFVYRTLCNNYEQAARRLVEEMRRIKNEVILAKSDAFLEFKENLGLLRLFLDNNGIPMPRPKWVYNDKDQSTWLFTPQKQLNKSFHMLQARRR